MLLPSKMSTWISFKSVTVLYKFTGLGLVLRFKSGLEFSLRLEFIYLQFKVRSFYLINEGGWADILLFTRDLL